MIEGFVDRIENSRLKGWAFDPSSPTNRVKLRLLHPQTSAVEFVASELREDLRDVGKGDGKCAFNLALPKSILNNDESQLSVEVIENGQKLKALRPLIDIRKQLSRAMIHGQGIEIGALHNPLWVSPEAKVSYVDRMGLVDLLRHYPNFTPNDVAVPDIVDDGEKLLTFENGSLDFIIANHMLEHCENPLGTLRSHLSKLRSGGVLYYTIPDMRFFHDAARDLTPFEHFVMDDKEGPQRSRMGHYREWARTWVKKSEESECEAEAKSLEQSNYSIHFHVWNLTSFADFILRAQVYLANAFCVDTIQFNFTEVICILRKR